MSEQQLQTTDRNELKVQALLERIATLTSQYENQDAERRIAITILGQQLEEAQNAQRELSQQLEEHDVHQADKEFASGSDDDE